MFSSNYPSYGDLSARVMTTLKSFSPNVEVYSIDEMACHCDYLMRNYCGRWLRGMGTDKLKADVVNCLILGFGLYPLVSYSKLTKVKFLMFYKREGASEHVRDFGVLPKISRERPTMDQISFATAEYHHNKKKTRRETFLEQMGKLIPGTSCCAFIACSRFAALSLSSPIPYETTILKCIRPKKATSGMLA